MAPAFVHPVFGFGAKSTGFQLLGVQTARTHEPLLLPAASEPLGAVSLPTSPALVASATLRDVSSCNPDLLMEQMRRAEADFANGQRMLAEASRTMTAARESLHSRTQRTIQLETTVARVMTDNARLVADNQRLVVESERWHATALRLEDDLADARLALESEQAFHATAKDVIANIQRSMGELREKNRALSLRLPSTPAREQTVSSVLDTPTRVLAQELPEAATSEEESKHTVGLVDYQAP